jgi:hypothetical protein
MTFPILVHTTRQCVGNRLRFTLVCRMYGVVIHSIGEFSAGMTFPILVHTTRQRVVNRLRFTLVCRMYGVVIHSIGELVCFRISCLFYEDKRWLDGILMKN